MFKNSFAGSVCLARWARSAVAIGIHNRGMLHGHEVGQHGSDSFICVALLPFFWKRYVAG